MDYLLLIYRKWPETETYWLINKPGLPVSPASPLLATTSTPSKPLLVPDLLATLTETLVSDVAVYTGYQFMNAWTTSRTVTAAEAESDSTDYFVLLGRPNHNSTNSPSPQCQNQTQTQNKDKGEAEENTNSHDPKHSHSYTMPSSTKWVSRDLARIDAHLSQVEQIYDSLRQSC